MTEPNPADAPHMGFSDLMSLSLSFISRLDTLWQRVLYSHAAIVGVMAFFATSDNDFAVARFLVFFFYTLNTAITIAAFRESYSGLRATLNDLQQFPQSAANTNVQHWVLQQSYDRHAKRRIWALLLVWLVLGYLLIYPIIFGILFS